MRAADSSRITQLLTPHPHRHRVSRRTILKAGAVTAAVVATASVISPSGALAAQPGEGIPVPVPANPAFGGLHIYGVSVGSEPASITDFTGFVGAAIVDGTGIGRDASGNKESLLFDTDMRFMEGTFRGTDGLLHEGTFAFV